MEKSKSLREQAEEVLRSSRSINHNFDNLSLEKIRTLAHELQVHQIELEMINEELILREKELQISNERFFNLFEFAPVGYLLLNENGIITQANFASATLLNVARSSIISKPFTNFIQREDQDAYYFFWKRLLGAKESQSIELQFRTSEEKSVWIQVTADVLTGSKTVEIQLTLLDISLRKLQGAEAEAEVEVRLAAEKKWSALVAAIPDYVMEIDKNYRLLYINQTQAGFKPEELVGKDITMMLPESERALVRKKYDQIFETGITESWELQAPISPEQMGWYRVSASRLVVANGNTSLLLISSDITERKQNEVALRVSEEKYKSYAENAPHGVFIADEMGRYIEVNEAAAEMTGYSKAELLQMSIPEMLTDKSMKEGMALFDQVIQNGKCSGELLFKHKTGSELWWHISSVKLSETRFLAFTKDITERKHMEFKLTQTNEYLSLAAAVGKVGIWDWDVANNVLTWDEQMFRLYGISKDKFGGAYETWKAEVHPEDAKRSDLEVQMALRGEKDFDTEFRIIWPDGTIRHIAARGQLSRNSEGDPIRLIGVNYDITERKQNEELLLHAKNAAESATRAKSEFLATMSHEIRTPLNGVIGFSDLLLKTELDDTQRKYMGLLNKSANSLLFLLNDILDFSKIEAGKLELQIEKVDILALTEESLEIIRFQADAKKINLFITTQPNVPRFILVDSIRIRQILINLLGNAVKFTKEGEIEMQVTVNEMHPQTGEANLLFSVRDTGIGISKQNREKIFDAFTQDDSSTSRKYGGTGLGLAISNKLLELMDSKLELETELGKGSRFYFPLPCQIAKSDQRDSKESKNDRETNSLKTDQQRLNEINTVPDMNTVSEMSLSNKELKILVVDDDEINTILANAILSKVLPKGIIINAANGIEALEQFKQEKPEIVLMDIQMPEMNGIDATIEIRKIEFGVRTPIIALTATSAKEDIENCFLAGMDDYATKPMRMNTVEKIVLKWVDNINSAQRTIETVDDSIVQFNFKEFKNRFEFTDETLMKILKSVTLFLTQSMEQVMESFNNKDLQPMNSIVHKIKGSALAIGNAELAKLSLELETKKEFDENSILLLIQKIEKEIELIKKMIGKYLREID